MTTSSMRSNALPLRRYGSSTEGKGAGAPGEAADLFVAAAKERVRGRARHARPRTKSRVRIRWRRLALAAVVLHVALTLCSQQVAIFRTRREIDRLNGQIAVERERAAILDAEIAHRNTDEFIELLARRELGMIRPGEIPVVAGVRPDASKDGSP